MKKYEYVNVRIGKLFSSGNEEHRTIINEYAKKDFKYVGYIPTKMNDHGKIIEIDLIFEKDFD